jgi:hypothetical protein
MGAGGQGGQQDGGCDGRNKAHDLSCAGTVSRSRQRRHCRNGLPAGRFDPILASSSECHWSSTIMISALEIGFALSASLLAFVYVLTLPRPKPVRIRTRDARSRRGPDA